MANKQKRKRENPNVAKGRAKSFVGHVLSAKNDKTVTVGIIWLQRDRVYKKARRKIKRILAHDNQNQASEGDRVLVEETRPLSARKRWRVVKIFDKAPKSKEEASQGTVAGE